jgi:hypothetical protein
MKKISTLVSFLLIVAVLFIGAFSVFGEAKAQNVGSLRTIVTTGFSFNKDLMLGDTDPDVKELQKVLNSSPDTTLTLDANLIGSPGKETTYFGALTKAAVIKFQNKYKDSILTPAGLTVGNGNVNKLTRTKLNLLLGVMTTPDSTGLPQNRPSVTATPAAVYTPPVITPTVTAPVANPQTCQFIELLINIGAINGTKASTARGVFNCTAPSSSLVPFVDLKIDGQSGAINVSTARNVTITWNSANVTSCYTASGAKTLSGSQTVPITASGNYVITCTGTNGTASDSVLVNFGAANSGNLSASCYATPASTTVNSVMVWDVNATGGNGNYTYEWAGDVASSSNKYIIRQYNTTGLKTAWTRVTSGGLSVTTNCVAMVNPGSVTDSAAKVITSFSFVTPPAVGVINESAGTISVTVPYGTNVTALTPIILGSGVSLSPASGITRNFTNPLTYTVTAVDGTTKVYTVTVSAASASGKAITSFSFANPAVAGVINESAHTINVAVPTGTVLNGLIPTVAITGVSVYPASGVAQNFTNPVQYTVTANNNTTQAYTVTVTASSTVSTTTATTTLPLSATCVANPPSAMVGQQITWQVTATGPGNYSYSWSGDGLYGSNSSLAKTYSSVGAKQANVTVTSGTLSTAVSCAAAIFSSGENPVTPQTPSSSGYNPYNSGSGSGSGSNPYGSGSYDPCASYGSGSGSSVSGGASGGLGYNSQSGWSGGLAGGISGSTGFGSGSGSGSGSSDICNPSGSGSGSNPFGSSGSGSGTPSGSGSGSGSPLDYGSGSGSGTGTQPGTGTGTGTGTQPGTGSGTGSGSGDGDTVNILGLVKFVDICYKGDGTVNPNYSVVGYEQCGAGSPNGTGYIIFPIPFVYENNFQAGTTTIGGFVSRAAGQVGCGPDPYYGNLPLIGGKTNQIIAIGQSGCTSDLRITRFELMKNGAQLSIGTTIQGNNITVMIPVNERLDQSFATNILFTDGATLSPTSGTAQNFYPSGKDYTLTKNGVTKTYHVNVINSTTQGAVTPGAGGTGTSSPGTIPVVTYGTTTSGVIVPPAGGPTPPGTPFGTPTPAAVNGVCNTNVRFGCLSGLVRYISVGYARDSWSCVGINGGTTMGCGMEPGTGEYVTSWWQW